MARFVIVITASDGTVSVCGAFASEYRATLVANQIEDGERYADVHEIEAPSAVLDELGELDAY